MESEEQWQMIGTCPLCDAPLYLMGDKVKYHHCPYDYMDELVDNINGYTALINDIDLIRARV